ncbi:HutD family protein [Flavobacterium agricola]|uniref:HutD family protein n=1 Tax=Flavobacterium agricola TaxID=2870839 RepID=A0ABY6M0B1_9FLAO|nr:HutD family protein [Flavobacterium agricola]UYW01876.1 HutD family protein [Flavobacterium agricola]
MIVTHIRKSNLIPSVWQGGETFEYAIYPPTSTYAARNFLVRLSCATITSIPSTFTQFSGYQRFLVMLDNELHISHNGVAEQYKKHELFTFNSNASITSTSLGNDFNLMLREDISAQVTIFPFCQTNVTNKFAVLFALQAGIVVINEQEYELKETDALWIENDFKTELNIQSNFKTVLALWD